MKNWHYGIVLFVLSSCSLLDSDSITPAYIVIEDVSLTTTSDQGYPSHQIEDVWVVVNEVNLGIYTLPARIPVIVDGGEANIRINAGVKPNGSTNESLSYPFYEPYNLKTNLKSEDELIVNPKFEYREDAVFDIIDDFETSTLFNKDLDGNVETILVRSSEQKVGGNFSGKLTLNSANSVAEFTTTAQYLRENNKGGNTYLEFDFLSDNDIILGSIVNTDSGEIQEVKAVFFATDEWKRVYIDFTNEFTRNDILSYSVKFTIEHSGGSESTAYFDNVKLVHF